MAWRPSQYLISGVLDNTQPGRVTGALQFAGMKENVRLELVGDFHRDIRGAGLLLLGDPRAAERARSAGSYFEMFSPLQTGHVGDITAGLPPYDYVRYPYIEWYSEQNGRVVLEYRPERVQVVGKPIPYQESFPISRRDQARNMAEFLQRTIDELMEEEQDEDGGDTP